MRRMLAAVVLLAACDHPASVTPQPQESASAATGEAPSAAMSAVAPTAGGVPCGDLGCAQFDSPREAFLAAIAGDPAVVAIGEAHAPRGATVASAAKRFT